MCVCVGVCVCVSVCVCVRLTSPAIVSTTASISPAAANDPGVIDLSSEICKERGTHTGRVTALSQHQTALLTAHCLLYAPSQLKPSCQLCAMPLEGKLPQQLGPVFVRVPTLNPVSSLSVCKGNTKGSLAPPCVRVAAHW